MEGLFVWIDPGSLRWDCAISSWQSSFHLNSPRYCVKNLTKVTREGERKLFSSLGCDYKDRYDSRRRVERSRSERCAFIANSWNERKKEAKQMFYGRNLFDCVAGNIYHHDSQQIPALMPSAEQKLDINKSNGHRNIVSLKRKWQVNLSYEGYCITMTKMNQIRTLRETARLMSLR